jgi:hypothetical protein
MRITMTAGRLNASSAQGLEAVEESGVNEVDDNFHRANPRLTRSCGASTVHLTTATWDIGFNFNFLPPLRLLGASKVKHLVSQRWAHNNL